MMTVTVREFRAWCASRKPPVVSRQSARIYAIRRELSERGAVFGEPDAVGMDATNELALERLITDSGLLEGPRRTLIWAQREAHGGRLVRWIGQAAVGQRRRVIWVVPSGEAAIEVARELWPRVGRDGVIIATHRPAFESPGANPVAGPFLDARPEVLAQGHWDVAICAPEALRAGTAINPGLIALADLLVVEDGSAEREPANAEAESLCIDMESPGLVIAGGREVRLSPMSWHLLVALARRPGAVVGRQRLYGQLWPGGGPEDQQLDAHRRVLCRELKDAIGGGRPVIEVLRGHGFRLTLRPEQVRLVESDRA